MILIVNAIKNKNLNNRRRIYAEQKGHLILSGMIVFTCCLPRGQMVQAEVRSKKPSPQPPTSYPVQR